MGHRDYAVRSGCDSFLLKEGDEANRDQLLPGEGSSEGVYWLYAESDQACGHLPAHDMFRVNADTLETYLDSDAIRRIDLQKLDKLLRKSAPGLKRHFPQWHTSRRTGNAL